MQHTIACSMCTCKHKGIWWTVWFDTVINDWRSIQKISTALLRPFIEEKSLSQLGLMCTILDGRFIDLPPQIHSLPQDGHLAVTQRSICADLVVVLHRPASWRTCSCQKQQSSSSVPCFLFTFYWLFFTVCRYLSEQRSRSQWDFLL